mgnify:CR=1 FL=1
MNGNHTQWIDNMEKKKQIIDSIRQALKEHGDPKARASSARFFKADESPKVYGVRAVEVRKIAKKGLKQLKPIAKQELFEICEELWKTGYLEEAFIACFWAESQRTLYEPADFLIFERWVQNHLSNWADCDTLCNHTIGSFLMKYPRYLEELKRWTTSTNRWVKRAAAVSLIIPARKGLFLETIFDIADRLLLDEDDLVQKGYGWMLKSASEAHQEEVFQYVMKHKALMPRTALRYAIEKMPPELKAKAMKK